MKLNTLKEIKRIGLEEFVNKYNLKHKKSGNNNLLKYDQLKTPKNKFTNECRGIIFDDDFNLVSLPLIRFENFNQNSMKILDLKSTRFFEKTDGTMIQYYFDDKRNKWIVGTGGTIEATDNITIRDKFTGERMDFDFDLSQLFHRTCENCNIDLSLLQKEHTYVFELSTESNKVINYIGDSIKLLSIRNLNTLVEYEIDSVKDVAIRINCDYPHEFKFESFESMLKSLEHVKYGDINFEGYVLIDKNFNRLKVKSNKYVVYSLFNGNISSKWRLMDIVKLNETEEVISTFPELEEELLAMKKVYSDNVLSLKEDFEYLRNNLPSDNADRFRKASEIIGYDKSKKILISIFSNLFKDNSISFEDSISKLDSKSLYKSLMKK